MLKGRSNVEAFGRQITQFTVFRAMALFLIYMLAAGVVVIILSMTETLPIDKVFFEAISAITTNGLGTGITPELSYPGRIVLIVAMYAGRLGPLAFMAFLVRRRQPSVLEYPHEPIRLG
jgi:trk system potassium uptake protein TrkH